VAFSGCGRGGAAQSCVVAIDRPDATLNVIDGADGVPVFVNQGGVGYGIVDLRGTPIGLIAVESDDPTSAIVNFFWVRSGEPFPVDDFGANLFFGPGPAPIVANGQPQPAFALYWSDGSGDFISFQSNVPVPEPSSLMLLLIAGALCAVKRIRTSSRGRS